MVLDPTTGQLKQVRSGPRFFYMASIIFDTSESGTFTRDLYAEYQKQFAGTPFYITGENGDDAINVNPIQYTGGLIGSVGAPTSIPTYGSNELYYYITYFDQDVFSFGADPLSADGKLTYTINNTASASSYMNIVFVVKD